MDSIGAGFYDLSQSDAIKYLDFVVECFSYCFQLAEAFYTRIGFIWIILATVFIVIVSRVIIAPIVGGKLDLGPDKSYNNKKAAERKYQADKEKYYENNRRSLSRFNSDDD